MPNKIMLMIATNEATQTNTACISNGLSISNIDYIIIEAVEKSKLVKNAALNPINAPIQIGLFGGLESQLLGNLPVLFMTLQTKNDTLIGLNLDLFNILSILVSSGKHIEHSFYTQSFEEQEEALSDLTDLMFALEDLGMTTDINKDVVDISAYKNLPNSDFADLSQSVITPNTTVTNSNGANAAGYSQTSSYTQYHTPVKKALFTSRQSNYPKTKELIEIKRQLKEINKATYVPPSIPEDTEGEAYFAKPSNYSGYSGYNNQNGYYDRV